MHDFKHPKKATTLISHQRGFTAKSLNGLRVVSQFVTASLQALEIARSPFVIAPLKLSTKFAHTRSTKLSTTRFSPALSNWIVSLLPSMLTTLPLPNFW